MDLCTESRPLILPQLKPKPTGSPTKLHQTDNENHGLAPLIFSIPIHHVFSNKANKERIKKINHSKETQNTPKL